MLVYKQMNHITSRVHYNNLFTLEAIKQFYDECDEVEGYIMCREEGKTSERDHIHMYMITTLTRKQIADKFTYKFKQLKGNQAKSFKVATDKDGTVKHAKQYTCKGVLGASLQRPPDIRGLKKFTLKQVAKYHKRYWDDKVAYEAEAKIKRKGLVGLIIKTQSITSQHTDRDIITKVIQYYLDNDRILPGKYKIGEIATTIKMKVADDTHQIKYIMDLVRNVECHM